MKQKNFSKILALVSALCALSVFLTACGAGTPTGEKTSSGGTDSQKSGELIDVSFGVGNSGTGGVLPVIAAYANFDEEFGLNFKLEAVDNASNTLAATEAGKVDIAGWSSAAPLAYIAEGNNLKIIGGLMSNYESLIVKPENKEAWSGDLTGTFLEGKTIAVNRTNSGDIALRAYLTSKGVNLSKVTYKELDSPSTVIEAVKKGTVDAGIVNGSFYKPAENQGLVNVQFVKDIIGSDFICCRQLVSPDSIEKNREVYVKVEKALIRAYQLYRTDPEKTVKLAKNFIINDESEINFLLYEYGDLRLSPDPNIQGIYNYFEGMKLCGYVDANNQTNITDYVDTSIYKEALDALIAEDADDASLLELKNDFKATAAK